MLGHGEDGRDFVVLVRHVDVHAVLGDVDHTRLQRRVDLAERHVDGLGTISGEMGVLGLGRLHTNLLALDVGDRLDLLLGVHVAQAHRQEAKDMGALHRLGHHLAEGLGNARISKRLGEVVLVAEEVVQREHAGLRRDCRCVGGHIAGAQLLQHHRLLAELRARELVDAELAATQLLQLGVENVRRYAVGRGFGLIIAESELALLCHSAVRQGDRRQAQCRQSRQE